MYRSYLCVEVVILLLLSHVGWNGPSSPRVQPCSRAQSRVARQLVRRKLTGVLQRYRVSLGPECPLHPSRDLFWWPPGLLLDDPPPGWSCPLCGRAFFCHEKLTSHWDEEHAPQLPKADRGVCMADYCDILRCDVLGPRLAAAERASAAGSTLPDKPKADDNCGAPPADHPRCSCDQKHMRALQQKCRIVVQQCVIGLLSVLSVKDFQDIEDELNNGICSYLTCNKYWDDSLNEERHVPMLFSMIIGIILVGGFCLCYYIVWIFFESIPLASLGTGSEAPYDDVYCNSHVRFSSFGLAASAGRPPPRQCHCRILGRHGAAYHKHGMAGGVR